ncbi:MAG: hypothetical protein ACYDAO_10000 [Thermoplasmataceae archaeon]
MVEEQKDYENVLVKLHSLPAHFVFKNSSIARTEIPESEAKYGQSFMIFYENNKTRCLTFVNEKSVLGKEIKLIYEKLLNKVLEITIDAFDEGAFRGFHLTSVKKIKDVDTEKIQTKLEGF